MNAESYSQLLELEEESQSWIMQAREGYLAL